jgi:hypothetical protein
MGGTIADITVIALYQGISYITVGIVAILSTVRIMKKGTISGALLR